MPTLPTAIRYEEMKLPFDNSDKISSDICISGDRKSHYSVMTLYMHYVFSFGIVNFSVVGIDQQWISEPLSLSTVLNFRC